MRLSRRRFAALVPLTLLAFACRRGPASERCPNCGMLVDRTSPFRAELVTASGTQGFDSPRCALASMRRGSSSPDAKLRVQEFYSRAYVGDDAVRFVGGSDVEGPMGAELVPVAPDKQDKFMRDHHGTRSYASREITADVLKKEGAP